MRLVSAAVLPILLAAFAFAVTPSLSAQTRIGEVVPVALESTHPVVGPWRGEVCVPGATLLKARLAHCDLGPGDILRVLDGRGKEIHSQTGPRLPGGWLPAVEGDRAVIEILPARDSRPWGLEIHEAAAATVDLETAIPETICNLDDRKNALCYDAQKRSAADAVGRMSFVEGGQYLLCTGSLVSSSSHFLTNNHCIESLQGAQSLEVWWRFQTPSCSGGGADKESVSVGAELLVTDPTLDFTLLRLIGDTPAQRYGHLTPTGDAPALGEIIWIPQHGAGNPKTFAVLSDMDGPDLQHPTPAKIQLASVAGNAPETDIGYYADTQGGSSGSPVLREDNTMVALHHFGVDPTKPPCTATNMNQGVKMSLIYPLIQAYLDTCSPSCSASVPLSAYAGATVAFASAAAGAGCAGEPAFGWDLGDGTVSAEQNPSHAFASPGPKNWSVRVDWAGQTCFQSGTLTVYDAATHKPGDCDGSGEVTIGEVQKAINMFLSLAPPDCGVDCEGAGTVSIGEVQKVINGFLGLPASCL